jgi:hypothetical protein
MLDKEETQVVASRVERVGSVATTNSGGCLEAEAPRDWRRDY